MKSNIFAREHDLQFLLDAVSGKISGTSLVSIAGENTDMDTGGAEDVWDLGGTYTWSTSAAIDSISSSNDNDTQSILISGLNANYEQVNQTVVLTGQTRVVLSTPLLRVNSVTNFGSVNIAGMVYVYENTPIVNGVPTDLTKVRAAINDGMNRSASTIYTVPLGKTAYIFRSYYGLSKKGDIQSAFSVCVRRQGGVFWKIIKLSVGSHTGMFLLNYDIPQMALEKTDLKVVCEEVSADNSSVVAGYTILLVDNK